ncbi:LysR substrate-binding domain-containing protein [Micromonospora sp. NPDC007230]|uniref:LysR substrate-binding domain-containing protein n=1 Tax=Micromonospora sp. NPDC007230 TaxID=3364237 RepID=UPI0036C36BA7
MYDPELLRTFLGVAEGLSFTAAGRRLGLSQPTVSQHIRRLEEQVGRALFVRDTRSVTLTADGEALVPLARDILAAHERAVEHFTGPTLAGRLRFGVTDDLALTPLPRILRNFRQLNPRIGLELTVLQNDALLRRIESGHLDMAFVKRSAGVPAANQGQLVRRDQWVWAAAEASPVLAQPVPLVAYQSPSLSRSMSVEALEAAGMRYRITCVARGVNGVLAAVRAGLGIAVFARSLLPSDLVELPASTGLPVLPALDLVLLTNPHAPEQATTALTSAILSRSMPLTPAPD